MRKLINKLFERLGYVPKKYQVIKQGDLLQELEPINHKLTMEDDYEFIKHCVKNNETEFAYYYYDMISGNYEFTICLSANRPDRPYFPIKRFNTDDLEYGIVCAEELCEMLNKKI